jgi:hypothetical protein
MGAPAHPHWDRNIEDGPHVTVEVTGASRAAGYARRRAGRHGPGWPL